MSLLLINGDALEIPLADESVHMVVTSPPYWGLRKYSGNMARVWGGEDGCRHEWKQEGKKKVSYIQGGECYRPHNEIKDKFGEIDNGATCLHCNAWYGELGLEPNPELYCANMVAVFREVWRVLHPKGTVFLNLGDSYAGSGGPGSQYDNKHAPKYQEGFTKYDNPNRDVIGLKPKDLVGIPWRVAFALQADGWWLRSAPPWIKNNPMPESCQDRPTTAHENWFLLTKKARYYSDANAVREAQTGTAHSKGTKLQPPIEDAGIGHKDWHKYTPDVVVPGGRNRRTSDFFYESLDLMINQQRAYLRHLERVRRDGGMLLDQDDMPIALMFNTFAYKGAHFATFSPKMIEPLIKFSTSELGCCPECGSPWERVVEKIPTGEMQKMADGWDTGPGGHSTIHRNGREKGQSGVSVTCNTTLGWRPTCDHDHEPVPAIVFDPFCGSGTTLLVARQLGRHGIGMDLSAEYLQLARERLSLDALEDWGQGKEADKVDLTDLPLFVD